MISTMYDESTIRAAIIKVMYYNDCRFRFVKCTPSSRQKK